MEDKLILKDLTYKIRGLLFEVQNELGNYCKEEQYSDRFEFKLKENGFNYTRKYILPKSFEGERHHRNRIDFLIEDILILEFKF
ncbi:MAG: GxxExxY protein, partial [Candidatus Magasanikiibacteriota bacterium]